MYSILSTSLQIEYIPDLSQELVTLSATATIILPLASLEMLSFFLQILLLATAARILSLVSFEICIIYFMHFCCCHE